MKPIKLEKLITPRFKYIEWKLHNVCNYDCSFCGEEHKDGSNRWKDLDTYKMYGYLKFTTTGSSLIKLSANISVALFICSCTGSYFFKGFNFF